MVNRIVSEIGSVHIYIPIMDYRSHKNTMSTIIIGRNLPLAPSTSLSHRVLEPVLVDPSSDSGATSGFYTNVGQPLYVYIYTPF